MADQHAGLSEDRWARFSRDQQLLMIANEMHRATKSLAAGETAGAHLCYERVLRLVDLTAAVGSGLSFRRELLRWRGLIGELYLAGAAKPRQQNDAMEALLAFSPATWAQVPFLLQAASA